MPVVIRLMRAGAKKRPFYRMVAADSRRQRDGRFLEILGHYNPLRQPYELVVHKDKVEKWILRGAQPSDQAASLLRSLGISMRRAAAAAMAAAEPAEAGEAGPAVPQAHKARKGKKAVRAVQKSAPRRKPRKISPRKARRKTARRAASKAGAAKS